ncbi:MAG: hypothetical protein AAF490_30980 [Chloroflexota bacterium]
MDDFAKQFTLNLDGKVGFIKNYLFAKRHKHTGSFLHLGLFYAQVKHKKKYELLRARRDLLSGEQNFCEAV